MSGPAERLRRLMPTLQAEAGAALDGRDEPGLWKLSGAVLP
jgi:hypothetical protein